jgi:hypothetical protein
LSAASTAAKPSERKWAPAEPLHAARRAGRGGAAVGAAVRLSRLVKRPAARRDALAQGPGQVVGVLRTVSHWRNSSTCRRAGVAVELRFDVELALQVELAGR